MSTGFRSIPPYKILDAVSMGASFTSAPFSVEKYLRIGIEILATGTPTGDVTVQVSNDYNPNISGSTANWFDMPLALTPLAGAVQDYIIDIQVVSFPWMRINYTRVSGTGTANATITAKEY